ncbi:hypothetical protein BDW22DRAFT_1352003 [Trametopsis cervina]|nr:hypothetical protein BDW22DRAFT_1352003 [Trametopsis cervina]
MGLLFCDRSPNISVPSFRSYGMPEQRPVGDFQGISAPQCYTYLTMVSTNTSPSDAIFDSRSSIVRYAKNIPVAAKVYTRNGQNRVLVHEPRRPIWLVGETGDTGQAHAPQRFFLLRRKLPVKKRSTPWWRMVQCCLREYFEQFYGPPGSGMPSSHGWSLAS